MKISNCMKISFFSFQVEKILDGHGALKQGFLSSSVSYCISDDPEANEVGEAMDLYKVPVLTVSPIHLQSFSFECFFIIGHSLPSLRFIHRV